MVMVIGQGSGRVGSVYCRCTAFPKRERRERGAERDMQARGLRAPRRRRRRRKRQAGGGAVVPRWDKLHGAPGRGTRAPHPPPAEAAGRGSLQRLEVVLSARGGGAGVEPSQAGREGGGVAEERAALCAAAAAGRAPGVAQRERGAQLLGRASPAGGCRGPRGAGEPEVWPARAGPPGPRSAAGPPATGRGRGRTRSGRAARALPAPDLRRAGRDLLRAGVPGVHASLGGARRPASVSAGFEPPLGGPLAFKGRQQARLLDLKKKKKN